MSIFVSSHASAGGGGVTDIAPVDASYGANWSDYGSGFQGAIVYKIGSAVRLGGIAKSDGTVADGETILTVPAGYEPAADTFVTAYFLQGSEVRRKVFIRSTGIVELDVSLTAAITWFNLEQVSYTIDS
jgi:hypothetical protein